MQRYTIEARQLTDHMGFSPIRKCYLVIGKLKRHAMWRVISVITNWCQLSVIFRMEYLTTVSRISKELELAKRILGGDFFAFRSELRV